MYCTGWDFLYQISSREIVEDFESAGGVLGGLGVCQKVPIEHFGGYVVKKLIVLLNISMYFLLGLMDFRNSAR